MLGQHGRSLMKTIFTPVARTVDKLGLTPNMITISGTVVTVVCTVLLLGNGYLAVGGIVLGLVLLLDSLDGVLARYQGKSSDFGAFLDSSLDRVGDGAVFACLTYWAAVGLPEGWIKQWSLIAGLAAMVFTAVVPYVRAKGEAFGVVAKLGITERTDRLIVSLVCAGLTDFGLPLWLYAVGLTWVAIGGLITSIQRMWFVHLHLQTAASSPA